MIRVQENNNAIGEIPVEAEDVVEALRLLIGEEDHEEAIAGVDEDGTIAVDADFEAEEDTVEDAVATKNTIQIDSACRSNI